MSEKNGEKSDKEVTVKAVGDTAGGSNGVRVRKERKVASLLEAGQQTTSLEDPQQTTPPKQIAALFLPPKRIDISHLILYGIGTPPEGFYWEEKKIIQPEGILSKILDVIELYDDDYQLVGTIHTSLQQYQRQRTIIRASCVYSTSGLNAFLSFLGQATDKNSYNISKDCVQYRELCEYFQSIATELTLDGKKGKHYSKDGCKLWY